MQGIEFCLFASVVQAETLASQSVISKAEQVGLNSRSTACYFCEYRKAWNLCEPWFLTVEMDDSDQAKETGEHWAYQTGITER